MSTTRILVVDDEYGVRSGIRQILEIEGYEVDEAATGEEALALYEKNEYAVALLDYRLPDMDGLTVLAAIKKSGREIMTCMITAYANIDTAIAATRQGVDFFLPKPFLPDDLLSVVETLVRHKAARVEAERLRRENEASLLALAEEKTQTHSLVSSLRDAVLVVNRQGDVVLANRAMTALLQTSEDQVLRRAASDLLSGGPLAPLAEQLAAPLKDRTIGQVSIGEQAFMASIVTFRDDDGAALGRILTLSDSSQLRRLAMEKERFIRTMVHELKSPLGAIRGLVAERLTCVESTHFRHHQVAQHNGDFRAVLRDNVQRLFPVRGFKNAILQHLQSRDDSRASHRIIFDNQDRLTVAQRQGIDFRR